MKNCARLLDCSLSRLLITGAGSRAHFIFVLPQVELVVLGTAQLPAALSLPPPHYYTSHLPLSHFIRPELTHYFEDGSFAAVSAGTKVDTDNVFAILPSGVSSYFYSVS